MKLTRNLKIFIILNLLTSGLLYYLSVLNDVGVEKVQNSDGTETITSGMPFLWMLIVAVSFGLLYVTDVKRNTRSNLLFFYHSATALIVLLPVVVIIALVPFTDIKFDLYLFLPLVGLLLSLLVHWFFTRNNPKGIEAKKVFK